MIMKIDIPDEIYNYYDADILEDECIYLIRMKYKTDKENAKNAEVQILIENEGIAAELLADNIKKG